MRDLLILFVHLLTTVVRLARPGGARSIIAESVLAKHQLLILNRSRQRAPNLRPRDRIVAGWCALFMRPSRLIRLAIVLKPSTLLHFHHILTKRKYRLRFSAKCRRKSGPQRPSKELIDAIVATKQRNPFWGCPRIAQQIALAFGVPVDKDVVRLVLATITRSRTPAVHPG
jgi:putative transposase